MKNSFQKVSLLDPLTLPKVQLLPTLTCSLPHTPVGSASQASLGQMLACTNCKHTLPQGVWRGFPSDPVLFESKRISQTQTTPTPPHTWSQESRAPPVGSEDSTPHHNLEPSSIWRVNLGRRVGEGDGAPQGRRQGGQGGVPMI